MRSFSTIQLSGFVILLSLVLFYPFLGQVHLFDWDEINFAEAAREMIVTGNYSTVQINYIPFWEKPPLFIWLQAISMKIFGVGEYAARFPNAFCGTLTLLLFYFIGKRHHNWRFGILWVLLYSSSLLPQLYFRSGIIDPWFNLFIFTGIYLAFLYVMSLREGKEVLKYIAFSGISIGFGILTKGPVALLVFLMVAGLLWTISRFKNTFTPKGLLTFLFCVGIAGGSWFLYEIANGRFYVVEDFIVYQIRLLQTQDAGHGGPFFYHWYVLLIGCFPLSIFALRKLIKPKGEHDNNKLLHLIMIILFWSVLLLFSLVKTKIIHYSSLCYFPLSYLATLYLNQHLESKDSKWTSGLLTFVGFLLLVIVAGVPLLGMNIEVLLNSELMNDPFAEANMQAEIPWSIIDFVPALFVLFGLIGFWLLDTKKSKIALIMGCMVGFTFMNVLTIPKIELITQNAAIEFYESKQQEDCYVETIGFFSYANLFYTRKRPQTEVRHIENPFLLTGKVDKPVYIVTKITKKDDFLTDFPNFSILYEKNGFVFYKRTDI